MTADLLIRGIAQLATPPAAGVRRGPAMRDVVVIEDAALALQGETIAWVGKASEWQGEARQVIDLGGRAIVPGLIDAHTHAVWAGDRLADFEARIEGKPYEAILAAGGGIWSTIRATSACSEAELVAASSPRIAALLRSGATTIEVKSGYGFTPEAELTSLRAIRTLATQTKARLVPTLLVHIPPRDAQERAAYLQTVCQQLIPQAAHEQLALSVDVFVEKEAWSVAEAEQIFAAARAHGLATRLHSEQFQNVGGVELAARVSALSVDHLEACQPEQVAALAAGAPVAVLLPGVSLHLGLAAAPGRKLIDAGAAVAIATDLNPGTSPLYSMQMALALSTRLNGLTAQEALVAGTVNAAAALGLANVGALTAGMRADFLVLDGGDWRNLLYTLGSNPVSQIWTGGTKVC
jgi:imidazolonepropionase